MLGPGEHLGHELAQLQVDGRVEDEETNTSAQRLVHSPSGATQHAAYAPTCSICNMQHVQHTAPCHLVGTDQHTSANSEPAAGAVGSPVPPGTKKISYSRHMAHSKSHAKRHSNCMAHNLRGTGELCDTLHGIGSSGGARAGSSPITSIRISISIGISLGASCWY